MRKETFTFSQMVFTLLLFLFGSSVVLGVSGEAGQDAWVSVSLAGVMMIPLMLMYARIMRLFPETDFFDILEVLFGKILGKIFILLFTWYAIHLCALVVRNFTEFLQIVSMPECADQRNGIFGCKRYKYPGKVVHDHVSNRYGSSSIYHYTCADGFGHYPPAADI